jgi:phosphotransferase system enzyme I (PtsI)
MFKGQKEKTIVMDKEIILTGIPLSYGICIGVPFFLDEWQEKKGKHFLAKSEIEEEIKKYRQAILKSKEELINLKAAFENDVLNKSQEVHAILDAHLEMVSDPIFHEDIEKRIILKKQPLLTVLRSLLYEYKKRLKKQEVRDRFKDILDIFKRILKHASLLSKKDIPKGAIIFANELVPSDAFEANRSLVKAFVSKEGGYTSHSAIIARSKGLPYVVDIDIKKIQKEARLVIVDGIDGKVIINPHEDTIARYRALEEEFKKELIVEEMKDSKVKFYGNIQHIEDIDDIFKYGAAGVGLFRSEYLFLEKKNFPTEEEQYNTYAAMAKKLNNLPLIIRIFDICLEKQEIMFLTFSNKVASGQRGVRFLLDNISILEKQLKSIIRASIFGDVKILVPFVTDVEEFLQVKVLVNKIARSLDIKSPKIGCMIEIPAAVFMIDKITKEADFLSIGSNDLIQYSMAALRGDAKMDKFFHKLHPAFLRILDIIVGEAKRQKKPLILCGEIVTEEKHLSTFIDMGIEAFSVAPCHIIKLKRAYSLL